MGSDTFVRLSDLVESLAALPGFGSLSVEAAVMDHVGVTDVEVDLAGTIVTQKVTVAVDEELAFDLPGFGGIQVVVGGGSGFFELPVEIVLDTAGGSLSFQALRVTGQLALRVPRTMLKPMRQVSGAWVEAPGETREFALSTTVTIGSDGNVTIDGGLTFELEPAMVADTGVIISASGVQLVFSDAAVPPGAPAGFRGVYIGSAALSMQDPGFPVTGLSLQNALIGSGGFSGDVDVDLNLAGSLAGFDFILTHFGLTFLQNAITGSDIRGQVNVPFFDGPVDVALSLSSDGTFAVGLASATGLASLSIDGLLDLELDSLEFASRAGVAELSLGGILTLTFSDELDFPSFKLSKLTVTSEGDVIIEGGWIDLGDALAFDFHGFQMELTRIGFGSEGDGATKRNWIGLSGSIKLVDGLAVGASVDGLKISWKAAPADPSDLDVQLTIDGIGVELIIPDVLEFGGTVHFLDDTATNTRGFAGDVHLSLPTLNFTGEASILVGRQGSTTFFYLAVAADLPLGIPLAQSGIAFYGFQGLIGFSVYPNRTPDQAWYEDWYAKPTPGVTSAMKWYPPVSDAFAIGLGATLGTFPDNGFAVSGKVLIALVFPGPLLLIEGRANFLAPRGDLNSTDPSRPPFRALMVLDGREGTVLLNLSAIYEKAPLIKLAALAEAFFSFGDPGAWHLYLGVDEPKEKRISAEVLDFLEARAYWMLTAADLRFGAWAGYEGDWKFGPLKVVLEAWIEGGATVGFDPVQIAGFLDLHGAVKLRAFGVGLGLSVDARLEAEAPKPFRVKGDFDVEIEFPWPIPDVGATVKLEWKGPQDPPDFPEVIKSISIEHALTGGSWNATGGIIPDSQPVPMDGRPVISFARAVEDGVAFTGAAATTPYVLEQAGAYTFKHRLTGVSILDITGGQPVPVSGVWKAAVAADRDVASKLEVRGKNPFDYYGSSSTTYAQWIVDHLPNFPCGGDTSGKPTCQELDTVAPNQLLTGAVDVGELRVEPAPQDSVLGALLTTGPGVTRGILRIREARALRVTFPGPVESVELLARVRGKLRGFAIRSNQVVGEELLVAANELQTMRFGKDLQMDDLVVSGGDADLIQICWRPAGSAEQGNRQSMLQLATAESIDQWYREEEIFKANRRYRVTVTTESTRSGPAGDDTNTETASLTFKTAAPPALAPRVHWIPPDTGEAQSGNPYDSLAPYVLETVPSAGQRPVYRSYDLVVNFNQNYIESMYTGDLRIRLFAPGDREVTTGTGLPSAWGRGRDLQLTTTEELWLNELSTMGCQVVDVQTDHIIHQTTLGTNDTALLLGADLRHEARLFAAGVEAHRFSFVTSRYRDFEEHLESFDGHVWVDEIPTPSASRLETLVAAARAGGLALDPVEAALFEELYYDVLGLPQRELPDAVEWSEVRGPGGAVGLLLASPEPIDWRRVTPDVRRRQFVSSGPGIPGLPLNAYVPRETVWIRHADGSSALVFFPSATLAAGPVPNGRFRITFTFARDLPGLPLLSVAGDSGAETATHSLVLPAVAQ